MRTGDRQGYHGLRSARRRLFGQDPVARGLTRYSYWKSKLVFIVFVLFLGMWRVKSLKSLLNILIEDFFDIDNVKRISTKR